MTAAAPTRRLRHPWALGIGVALVLPQLVLCVVVSRAELLTALAGFLMTIGFLRLGVLGYRVLRERTPPVGHGWLLLAGLVATVAGSLLWSRVSLAIRASADAAYTGAIAPPSAVLLNVVVVLTLGLWITGAAMLIWSLVGLVAARSRR